MIYSLPSLNGEDPAKVEGILANLTLGMLPNPGISEEPSLPRELRDRLIHEIRIRLRLKRDDNSPKAMSKIYDYLAKEIGRASSLPSSLMGMRDTALIGQMLSLRCERQTELSMFTLRA